MVWLEPRNHSTDCYFCILRSIGYDAKNMKSIQYPSLDTSIRPVPHSDHLPVPVFNRVEDSDDSTVSSDGHGQDVLFEPQADPMDYVNMEPVASLPSSSRTPQYFNQCALNDLIRDLNHSKESSELLAPRLNEKHVLASGTMISFDRNREKDLQQYFSESSDKKRGRYVYCKNIEGLLTYTNMIEMNGD